MKQNKYKQNMIYTPSLNIPLGERYLQDDGTYALRIKKASSKEYEIVTVDTLMKLLYGSSSKYTSREECRDSNF